MYLAMQITIDETTFYTNTSCLYHLNLGRVDGTTFLHRRYCIPVEIAVCNNTVFHDVDRITAIKLDDNIPATEKRGAPIHEFGFNLSDTICPGALFVFL